MAIEDLLNSTMPLLCETGDEEWPYAFAGTCFPVKWKRNTYIISAGHCYKNHELNPTQTLYPIPEDKRTYFGFSDLIHGTNQNTKCLDQIAIQISNKLHPSSQTNLINALDLSNINCIANTTNPETVDVLIRGYPFGNPLHKIDYELSNIKSQAYVTDSYISTRPSNFNECIYIKFDKPKPNNIDANGMSGSPIYSLDKIGNIKYSGMIIEFNALTGEYLAIGPNILYELLRQANI